MLFARPSAQPTQRCDHSVIRYAYHDVPAVHITCMSSVALLRALPCVALQARAEQQQHWSPGALHSLQSTTNCSSYSCV